MMDQHWTNEEVERFADGEPVENEQHVRDCAVCANGVLAALRMKQHVRAAMDLGTAPAALRQRLSRPATSDPRPAMSWLAIAAAFALVVFGAAYYVRNRTASALPELVDMHVTTLASANPVDVISTDRHTVKPWFEGHLPFGVPVPDLASTPFRLIGGRVVYWNAQPAAYLLVGKNAHRISVFAFPSSSAPTAFGAAPPGISTLTWNDRGLTFIAVAEVPKSDLVELCRAFRRQ